LAILKDLTVGPVKHNFETNDGLRPAIILSLDTTYSNDPLIKPLIVVQYQLLSVDDKQFFFRLCIDTTIPPPQDISPIVNLRFWGVLAEAGQMQELDPQDITPDNKIKDCITYLRCREI
jgi:hypothetical protein